ncbi:MAG: tRNA (guanine-N(1)-)-methyltransferase [Eubacteriales bacterium SKADARSKE-1]|nr:tRNA (guanine-N(1)-)-methyltransferase [Eubacteriales bacterium SKADARSKE-1]
MRIDIMTLFPDMCDTVMNESIIGRAQKSGALEVKCHCIRDYTYDKHNRVDDTVCGPGMGMLMMAEPIAACFEGICQELNKKPKLIYMSPQGKVLTQQKVKELAVLENIVILCGHYEGIDERVIEELVDEEISIGDYVLTGGELPALVLADAVSRLVPGVLSSAECFEQESHFDGILEYPQYTKPAVWRGKEVPSILLSGNHAKIEKWRREKALIKTFEKRPDLLEKANLQKVDKEFICKIIEKNQNK